MADESGYARGLRAWLWRLTCSTRDFTVCLQVSRACQGSTRTYRRLPAVRCLTNVLAEVDAVAPLAANRHAFAVVRSLFAIKLHGLLSRCELAGSSSSISPQVAAPKRFPSRQQTKAFQKETCLLLVSEHWHSLSWRDNRHKGRPDHVNLFAT
jgi:hypothetical protein